MNENMKEALSRYNSISVLNETSMFIPALFVDFLLLIIIPLIWEQDWRDAYKVIAFSCIICFSPIYLYCLYLVRRYNQFLSKSIIITDVEIQEISYIEQISNRSMSSIAVQYKYIAPDGKTYESIQKTELFSKKFEPNQRRLWMDLLQSKNLHIIVAKEDYSKSYFPLCEEYCIAFKRRYVVHLLLWDRNL